jgi:hypothetical protein
MKYFHEVRKEVVRPGPPIIVEVGEVIPPSSFNFRSTFDYPMEVAQKIRDAGNTAGLKGLPISCACLYIDVDENESVDGMRELLLNMGNAFDEYRTGNRGAHFHIPLKHRITGTDVLYTVTAWLKEKAVWHLIDSSIYREGGQFRMESAVHAKTGKTKVLTNEYDGELLELELKTKPPEKPRVVQKTGSSRDFFLNLLLKRGAGQRHMHMYILWKSGLASGLTEEQVGDAIRGWNNTQDSPHTDRMVDMKLEDFSRKER